MGNQAHFSSPTTCRGMDADFDGAMRQISELREEFDVERNLRRKAEDAVAVLVGQLADQRRATQAAARLASSARDQLAEDRRDDQLVALRAEVAFQRGRAEAFRSLARK